MSKVLIGVLLGSVLGCIDGMTAFFYPEVASQMASIIAGSTGKGLITGLAMGFLARRFRSVPLGVVAGLLLGLGLATLVAALSTDPQGNHHYAAIMLPGSLVGLIVGFATQRYGRVVATPRS